VEQQVSTSLLESFLGGEDVVFSIAMILMISAPIIESDSAGLGQDEKDTCCVGDIGS